MSDFTYDNEDFSAIRVATKDLSNAQARATLLSSIGSATFIGYHYLMRKAPNSIWVQSPTKVVGVGLVSACAAFTLLTWFSRSRLDDAAAHINAKYSSIISRTLNYEGRN